LVTNKKIAHEMGGKGRKAVNEKYNWTIEAKKLLDIYSEL
jgi:glycosyltransferase involved in cell wall biosynthesis